MDLLVVVGAEPPPDRLKDRSRHLYQFGAEGSLQELVGSLRATIPRRISVWGPLVDAAPVAAGLRQAGLPTEIFTDEPVPPELSHALTGVDVRPVTDPGTPMDVAESVIGLIGRTPMVRLDRTAIDLECTL